jgi:hypothetical protein
MTHATFPMVKAAETVAVKAAVTGESKRMN